MTQGEIARGGQHETERLVNPDHYLGILRRGWLTLLLTTLIGGAIGGALGMTAVPQYQATTSVFFSLTGGDSTTQLLQGSTFAQNQVRSYELLVTTPAVLQPVITELGLQTTPKDLARQIQTEVPLDTVLVDIAVADPSAEQASRIANATAAQLAVVVGELSPTGDPSGKVVAVEATTVAPATPPEVPFTPNKRLDVALGLLLGFAVGAAIVVVRDVLDNKVRDERSVAALTEIPVIGIVGYDSSFRKHPVLPPGATGQRAEAIRRLGSNLSYLHLDASANCVLVTSAMPNEGKTSTAVNLALSLAENYRVALVDADLRRPSLSDMLGLAGGLGLVDVITGRASLDQALQPWARGTVQVLTAGPVPPNPSQLLAASQTSDLMRGLKERFDYVIIDTAPLLPVHDAALLGQIADTVLVVVNARATTTGQFTECLRSLELVGLQAGGIVLNQATAERRSSYYEDYVAAPRQPLTDSPPAEDALRTSSTAVDRSDG